jgi:hypothetical protein
MDEETAKQLDTLRREVDALTSLLAGVTVESLRLSMEVSLLSGASQLVAEGHGPNAEVDAAMKASAIQVVRGHVQQVAGKHPRAARPLHALLAVLDSALDQGVEKPQGEEH